MALKHCSQRKERHMEMCGGARLREGGATAASNQHEDTHYSQSYPQRMATRGEQTL